MPDEFTDRALVDQVQAGDDRAFDVILARYRRPVLDLVYRLTGDAGSAEDIAQDVFVRAYRGLARYRTRPDAAFSAWLFRIARNAAIDTLRRRGRDPVSLARGTGERLDQQPSSQSVSDDLHRREVADQVAAAVAALPEDQRAAVILSEYEGQADAEIAAAMGGSVKSAQSRLYRARQTLRAVLAPLLK